MADPLNTAIAITNVVKLFMKRRVVDTKKPVSVTNATSISGASLMAYGYTFIETGGSSENYILGAALIAVGLGLVLVKGKASKE